MSDIPDTVHTALAGLRALGGDALAKQMAAVFIEYSAGRVDALQGALDAGNLPDAAGAAHTLKGSARQLGLTAMAEACFAVEQASKQGDAAAARTLAAAVHETYTTAVNWLRSATA